MLRGCYNYFNYFDYFDMGGDDAASIVTLRKRIKHLTIIFR